MKVLILLTATLVAAASAASLNDAHFSEWEAFKTEFGKTYADDAEEKFRMNVFFQNKKIVEEHNAKFTRSEVTYEMGINHLSDLLNEELMATMAGCAAPSHADNHSALVEFVADPLKDVPPEFDWRPTGAVTPVKNQGPCGSCYAFSAIGALESQFFLKNKKIARFSEQQVVDCSGPWGNKACNGGWMFNVFNYIKDNNGIDTEESYPYTAKVGPCAFNPTTVGAKVTGGKLVRSGDEEALKQAVAQIGPMAVAIRAFGNFQGYKTGVFYEPACNVGGSVNHAVLVVGYGTENGVDYWLVKNSWGPGWGDHGYIKMARNRGNNCFIANNGMYPTI